MRVYLADLVHNSVVLANDCMPLNVGYIKAVLDKEMGGACESRLFKYPECLEKALATDPPDVLMLSNYVWNEALSVTFASEAKKRHPEMLVVMGGPNLPLDRELQVTFMKDRPAIDIYILGEGEFTSVRLLKQYSAVGRSITALKERPIPYALYVDSRGEVVCGDAPPRTRSVDDIPSPWLNGSMDEFFDGKLAPMIETNRGCPFKCTFCVQGTDWYTKVNYFSLERVKEEIHYIGRQIKAKSPEVTFLRIADSNFGMFERDIEISREIGRAQKAYDWPTYIDATTGKNQPRRVIAALSEANNAIVMYTSVQSLDAQVLANIKRENIKLEAYSQIQMTVQGRGLRALTELILGLPGETLASHINGIHQVVDAGSRQITAYQAMILNGSELGDLETRSRWKIETSHRVLPRNFGIYCGQKVFEVEEIVTSTSTLSFEEYLEARLHHFFVMTVINGRQFDPAVRFLQNCGVKPSQLLQCLAAADGDQHPDVRQMLDDFLGDTRHELFPSKQACVDFYSEPEHFEALKTGQLGNNLLFKYRAIATTQLLAATIRFVFDTVEGSLLSRADCDVPENLHEFWRELQRFTELRIAHGDRVEQLLQPATLQMNYDFPRWLTDGCPTSISEYRLDMPDVFTFALRPGPRSNIQRAYSVWKGDSLLSMAKLLTRVHYEDFVRDCHRTSDDLS